MGIADGEVTSMALCWRLERTDGAGIALTSHDEAFDRDGVTYAPAPGMMPASITRSIGLNAGAGEVSGALSSDAIEEKDLALGRWDGAGMRLSAFDWTDAAGEPITLLAGQIGSVALDGDSFSADLQGAAARLHDPVCPSTSAECRAQFGDRQCRVDLAGRTMRATVVETNGSGLTVDQSVDERYVLGRLRFMSGDNCGLTSVVLSAVGSTLQLRDLPRGTVQPGCRVELHEGCDKRFETCVSRFGNAVNFRGEPHLPGNDLLTRYPGA
jgi:uncharacterized phage protein (TIGR02218 family)